MGCNPLSNPYYIDACGIQSEQTLTVYNYFYSNAILTASAFIVPTCNSTISFKVSGLAKTYPGLYIWNPTYGYFKIVNYNYATCTLTVLNECQTVNASPGFGVPSCTVFLVVDTPCCFNAIDYLNYPYVAVDFIVPSEGNCTTIKLTNVHGLILGQFVDIAGGRYYLQEVTNSTDIVICNLGEGGIPGSVVYAKNAQGEYITPVTIYVQEICDRDAVSSGALNICESTTNAPVLAGSFIDFVPALIDVDTEEVAFMDPNDAYALSICSQDLSSAIEFFNEEESVFLASDTTLTLPTETITRSITVTLVNDTCHYLYMDVGVSVFMIAELDVDDGDYANFTLELDALAPSSSPSTSPSASPSSSPSSSVSHSPSSSPSSSPSESPSTSPSPSSSPSESPSASPSSSPSESPSASPSISPSSTPSSSPSTSPSAT